MMSMLLGREQVGLKWEVLEEVSQIAVAAWRRLPCVDGKTTLLAGIKQKQDESYKNFIARLEETLDSMLPPSKGSETL